MDAIDRSFDAEFVTTVGANFGNHVSTGTALPVAVKTLKSDGETYFGQFAVDVRAGYRDANFFESPFVIGQGLVDDWFTAMPIGTQDSGDVLPELLTRKDMMYGYDKNVETVLGANEFFTFAPGVIQIIPFVRFAGPGMTKDTEIYKQISVVNPRSGMEYDVVMNFDCGIWKCQVMGVAELKFLPTDLSAVGDTL